MRTFDFSLFGDSFSVVIPTRAPRWQTAMHAGSGSVSWAAIQSRHQPAAAMRAQANVLCDDEGDVGYNDDDYAVFETIKAYDYQD